MKYSRHVKCCFLASIIFTLMMVLISTCSWVTMPSALASSRRGEFFIDSTPSLIVYPASLNEQNCQTSDKKAWTCTVTLQGENLSGILVIWNAYTSNSSISINPGKGNLVELQPTIRVTISNIPCMNTSFLFSGQVYGGGGVIPATVTWSCLQRPTPTPIPTYRPTPIPTPRPTAIPTLRSSPTSKATVIPRPTLTITLSPVSVISKNSQSSPSPMENDNFSSADMVMLSAFMFVLIVALIELVIIVLIRRRR